MSTQASVRCLVAIAAVASFAPHARCDDPPSTPDRDPETAVLEDALAAARAAPDPEAGALAAASLAWTAARRERPALARTAAQVAVGLLEQVVESGDEVHLRARARLGAAFVRLDDGRAAAPHFAAGVSQPAPARVLAGWIHAFADAAAHRAPTSDELLTRMFAAIERLEGGERAYLLRECAADLRRLGVAERALAMSEALLERELSVEALEDLVVALADLGAGRPRDGAQERVWAAVLAAQPVELDELAPPMIAAVLGEADGDPWDAANKLGIAVEQRGNAYGALLCRQAAIVYLARLGAPTARADVALEKVLELAWAHGRGADADWEDDSPALQRMHVLGPTTRLIPKLLAPTERLARLRRERDRALEREESYYVLNVLLGSCARAAGDLEGDGEALKLVNELVDQVTALHRKQAAQEAEGVEVDASPLVLFDALGACATAASTIAADGSARVIARVSDYAQAQLAGLTPGQSAEATLEGLVFVPAELLVTCATANAKLGQTAAAQEQLAAALEAVRAADPGDRAALVAAALTSAKALARGDRVAIAATAMSIMTTASPDLTEVHQWEDAYTALDACLTAP